MPVYSLSDVEPKAVKWIINYATLATFISKWSKEHKGNGAVIYDNNFKIVSVGFNGTPAHLKGDNRITVDHAERNAINHVAQLPPGTNTIVTTKAPCVGCAQAIIDAGIRVVVHPPMTPDSKWNLSTARALLLQKDIIVIVINKDLFHKEKI